MSYLTQGFGRLLSVIALLFVIVLGVVACGPAAEYHAEQDRTLAAQQEPTPDACPFSEGSYPNLGNTLAALVSQYETCALTEEGAASKAPVYHQNTVLIEIDAGTRERERVSALDSWMGGQAIEPRHVLAEWEAPYIYAYVRVSMLGALSENQNVNKVKATIPPYGAVTESDNTGAMGSSETAPRIPNWMQGDIPSPGTFPKLKGMLGLVAKEHAASTLYLEEWANDSVFGCYVDGDKVGGYLYIFDGGKVESTQNQLTELGVEWNSDVLREGEFYVFAIKALPSQLAAISALPDLVKVSQGLCGGVDGISGGRSRNFDTSPASFGRIRSEGVSVIGADDWHNFVNTPFNGAGVKIGVIDNGFKGIDSKISAGELPTPTQYICFKRGRVSPPVTFKNTRASRHRSPSAPLNHTPAQSLRINRSCTIAYLT